MIASHSVSSLLLSILLSSLSNTNAFLFKPAAHHPQLHEFVQSQTDKTFQIRLNIQDALPQGNAFSMTGPLIQLTNQDQDGVHAQHAQMPVATGPHPHLSSGTKSLEILKDGFLVDLSGMKNVRFEKGSWEMAWKDGQNSGMLVCAFDIPQEVSRNDAMLPPCRMFAEFHLWTKEGLMEEQAYKRVMEERLREHEQEKDAALQMCRQETNLFHKILHYHKALQAVEKNHETPKCAHIPDDAETIELSDGLVMTQKGAVWLTTEKGATYRKMGMAQVSVVDHLEKDDSQQSPVGQTQRL